MVIPIFINRDTTFLMSDESGDIADGAELGFYVDNTRVVRRYALMLDGRQPVLLSARQTEPSASLHFLTNPALDAVTRGSLSIVRRRAIDDGLIDDIEIKNYGRHPAELSVEIGVEPDAAHIIDVRQRLKRADRRGRSRSTVPILPNGDGRTWLACDGSDPSHHVAVDLCQPMEMAGGRWSTRLRLESRETWHLCVRVMTRDQADHARSAWSCRREPATQPARERVRRADVIDRAPHIDTDSVVLQRAYERSVRDLAALRIEGEATTGGEAVIAAGIPWFMALFGRDSLIAAYQALPFYPDMAKGVLRALTRLQGERVDPARCEEPGKILHEHRPGATNGFQCLIPGFPYFGTIDATPLFLMVLAAVYRVTGDLDLVRSLRSNALRALEWMERYGDRDGDGYLEYTADGQTGLANHGWKDSFDAVQFRDGTLARQPIALCEVQGYAYAARIGMAEVLAALGEHHRAAGLLADAEQLRERFERDFWLPDRGYYALALDGEKRPVDAITSNPGHLLWTGIVSPERALLVARRLLSPELFSGWGVRSMASGERGYNPLSYHTGSVWPHDTSLIVAGLARYGFVDEAGRLVDGLLAAVEHAPDLRLPEVFAGYSSSEAPFPVEHPMTSRPQAWAAGALLLSVSTMLGVDPSVRGLRSTAFLPGTVARLSVDGLTVGAGRTSIRVERDRDSGACCIKIGERALGMASIEGSEAAG